MQSCGKNVNSILSPYWSSDCPVNCSLIVIRLPLASCREALVRNFICFRYTYETAVAAHRWRPSHVGESAESICGQCTMSMVNTALSSASIGQSIRPSPCGAGGYHRWTLSGQSAWAARNCRHRRWKNDLDWLMPRVNLLSVFPSVVIDVIYIDSISLVALFVDKNKGMERLYVIWRKEFRTVSRSHGGLGVEFPEITLKILKWH